MFAVSIATFLFLDREMLSDPFHIDAQIFWSYGVIPPLVLIGLAVERKLGFIAAMLDTIELVCLKFAVTYTLATVLWAMSDGPPKRVVEVIAPPVRSARRAPVITPIDPANTTRFHGVVTNTAGQPVAGALVHIAEGLDEFVFAASTSTVILEHDGTRFRPTLSIAMVRQPILTRSLDGRLHTMLRHHPALAAGEQAFQLQEPLGVVVLLCGVHPKESTAAYLAVLNHPFAVITGADGRYDFTNVPRGELTLAAFHPTRGRSSIQVAVESKEVHRDIVVGAAAAP